MCKAILSGKILKEKIYYQLFNSQSSRYLYVISQVIKYIKGVFSILQKNFHKLNDYSECYQNSEIW